MGGAVLEDVVLGGALLGSDGMKRGGIRRAGAVLGGTLLGRGGM